MGDTHEVWNKKYLAEQIAEEVAKKLFKVNSLSYDLWYYYEVVASPYNYCTTVSLDILSDMGAPAQELETIEPIGFDCEIWWDPGNVGEKKLKFDKGTKIALNKRIDTFYIHPLETSGIIKILVNGYSFWDP